MLGDTITEAVDLHRLVFHPADFDKTTDKLKGAAFLRGDILALPDANGLPKYISVDRRDIIDQKAVDDLIENQKPRVKNRKIAKFAVAPCQDLLSISLEDSGKLFEVRNEELPGNLAHCGIHNIDKNKPTDTTSEDEKELYITEVRTELLSAFRSVVLYSDVFPVRDDENLKA
jgi:hypothetical protein